MTFFQKRPAKPLVKTCQTTSKGTGRSDYYYFHTPALFSTRYALRLGALREISSAINPVTKSCVPITMAIRATKNNGRWVSPVLSKKNFEINKIEEYNKTKQETEHSP